MPIVRRSPNAGTGNQAQSIGRLPLMAIDEAGPNALRGRVDVTRRVVDGRHVGIVGELGVD
jgi:hypothetical protein